MGLTSILQIFMAVAMYHLTKKGRSSIFFCMQTVILDAIV
jgi:hypothetical protein